MQMDFGPAFPSLLGDGPSRVDGYVTGKAGRSFVRYVKKQCVFHRSCVCGGMWVAQERGEMIPGGMIF